VRRSSGNQLVVLMVAAASISTRHVLSAPFRHYGIAKEDVQTFFIVLHPSASVQPYVATTTVN
jgi:hypothetical protein